MSTDGIQASDGAAVTIRDCKLYDNTNMAISVMNEGSTASIRSCEIWDNGAGIYVRNAVTAIKKSSIKYSSGNGVEVDFSSDTELPVVTIDSCTIGDNGGSGIVLSERAAPEIHYCAIFSNGESESETAYGIKLNSYTATDTVRAENNFWGYANMTEEEISALIYDEADNPTYVHAYVSFTPWLIASPVSLAPPRRTM
jgi:hypothetical protein